MPENSGMLHTKNTNVPNLKTDVMENILGFPLPEQNLITKYSLDWNLFAECEVGCYYVQATSVNIRKKNKMS